MATYLALARDNLLGVAIAVVVIVTIGLTAYRMVKQRQKRRRAVAWTAMRAEQDRIWNERINSK